jgi:DNA-directed RNA polymerase specialized sigma24 family protein
MLDSPSTRVTGTRTDPPAAAGSPSEGSAADAALFARLVADRFAGPVYEQCRATLARYAYKVLRRGNIFELCASKKIKGLPKSPSWDGWTNEDIDDLLQETVIGGLNVFRQEALAGRGWRPDGGASLRTYFIHRCLFVFAAVYRRNHLDRNRRAAAIAALAAAQQARPVHAPDAAEVAVNKVAAEERLANLSPRERVVVQLAAAGYSYAEISGLLADGTSLRRVEGMINRYRKHGRQMTQGDPDGR